MNAKAKRGAAVFQQNCVSCHNKQPGDGTPFGPPNLHGIFGSKPLVTPAVTPAQATDTIKNGKAPMPAFGDPDRSTNQRPDRLPESPVGTAENYPGCNPGTSTSEMDYSRFGQPTQDHVLANFQRPLRDSIWRGFSLRLISLAYRAEEKPPPSLGRSRLDRGPGSDFHPR